MNIPFIQAATAALFLSSGIGFSSSKIAEVKPFSHHMGDVDVWAGLSTPVRPEKAGPRDAAKICLALNAYHEARGEGWAGQVAVGQVALRRAGMDYSRVCKEIFKPAQFSWTTHYPKGSPIPTGTAWQWALAAAEESLKWVAHPEQYTDYSNRATFFHSTNVNPFWNKGLELVAMIGEHRFYR
jgi:spore germination cell wall hydrolase CwlJ-like protein